MKEGYDEKELKEKLGPEAYRIIVEAGTEPRGTGEYIDKDDEGVYRCKVCGQKLFDSDTKFESHGWPSFYDTEKGSVEFRDDNSHGMERTEVLCSNCGAHLGHVFQDGPEPAGERYCINSASLDFETE